MDSVAHTTIRLKVSTREALADQGKKFDTYDMIINKMIESRKAN